MKPSIPDPRPAAVVLLLSGVALAGGGSLTRISVGPGGAQASSSSLEASGMSADGRYVVFNSSATGLVPGDTNGIRDVFVRDRMTGATEVVSVSSAGVLSNGISFNADISVDGRWVVFTSHASNLAPGDANGIADIYLRDRQLGTTALVSVTPGGAAGNSHCFNGTVSADGRYVAFASRATDLGPLENDTAHADLFVRDMVLGTTTTITTPVSSGTSGDSFHPHITPDGRYVEFISRDASLLFVPLAGFGVFRHDRLTGTTIVREDGAGNPLTALGGSISADGRWIAFDTEVSLVPEDAGGTDVYVWDVATGATTLVSRSIAGTDAGGEAARISGDGTRVCFLGRGPGHVSGASNAHDQVYVRDLASGTTRRISSDPSGAPGDADSGAQHPTWHFSLGSIAHDGRSAAFSSDATNLVAGDTNGEADAFAWSDEPTATAYCSGDGSGAACPCGNASAPGSGAGCLSSLGSGGLLAAQGAASIAADTLVLAGSGMPDSSALYFQGTTRTAGGAGIPFGDGLRCASGSVTRLAIRTNALGVSQYPIAGDASVSAKGAVTTPSLRTYQVWYRNAASFCTSSTFNLSNGLEVAWSP